MKLPHLTSAIIALAASLLCALSFAGYAQALETRYIHAIAPLWWQQKGLGSALQGLAFRQPDLLPIYGSSDLEHGAAHTGRAVFADYPTGFSLFPVGWSEIGPLNMILELAASRSTRANKKVVISLSPEYFINQTPDYAGNFSDLTASEVAFSEHLSLRLKQEIAQRMLAYPDTLNDDLLLRFALQQLARPTWPGRVLYAAVFPLGRLHLWLLRLQDHWEVVRYVHEQRLDPVVQRKAAQLDWSAIITNFHQQAKAQAHNNRFGFADKTWNVHQVYWLSEKDDLPNNVLRKDLHHAETWHDLALLLRETQELGAHVLILTVPLKGNFFDYRGNSATTRALYYAKLRRLSRRYAVPVVTFQNHENDKYFIYDAGDHLSKEGWAYYDQVLDRFYHNELP